VIPAVRRLMGPAPDERAGVTDTALQVQAERPRKAPTGRQSHAMTGRQCTPEKVLPAGRINSRAALGLLDLEKDSLGRQLVLRDAWG
jgi:hypothetical protein